MSEVAEVTTKRDDPEDAAPRTAETTNVSLDCGWGTLHFADTYESAEVLATSMRGEGPGRRDIAFYVEEPHVMLSAAPLELFLDPSHAFRLDLTAYEPSDVKPEWMTKRGCSTPCCTQRRKSSSPGFGPEKAPTSWPLLPHPQRPRPSPIGMLKRSVGQPVWLSPLQVCCA